MRPAPQESRTQQEIVSSLGLRNTDQSSRWITNPKVILFLVLCGVLGFAALSRKGSKMVAATVAFEKTDRFGMRTGVITFVQRLPRTPVECAMLSLHVASHQSGLVVMLERASDAYPASVAMAHFGSSLSGVPFVLPLHPTAKVTSDVCKQASNVQIRSTPTFVSPNTIGRYKLLLPPQFDENGELLFIPQHLFATSFLEHPPAIVRVVVIADATSPVKEGGLGLPDHTTFLQLFGTCVDLEVGVGTGRTLSEPFCGDALFACSIDVLLNEPRWNCSNLGAASVGEGTRNSSSKTQP